MPYPSEIRVSDSTGGAPSITADLTMWELSTTIDNAGNVRQRQTDQETISVPVAGGVNVPFAMQDGPSYLDRNNHTIALAAYQQGMPGPMFRSGRFDSLPAGSPGDPNGLIDIMLVAQQRFTIAEINAMIPTPITLPDGNIVSTATITSAPPSRNLTLVATGPYGATTYTFTLTFVIDPSNDQVDLTSVLEANTVLPGVAGGATITFAAGPGGGFQAFLDNLFQGLFIGRITQSVLGAITASLNSTTATAAANAAAAQGFTGGIPAGVVLGARSVSVAGNGDLVISTALGSFGSIIQKFVASAPAAPTGSIKCPGMVIATMLPGTGLLPILYALRDDRLAKTPQGRELIGLYYRHSAEVAAILRSHPLLLARAARFGRSLTRPGGGNDGTPSQALVEGCLALAQEAAAHGSAPLREAVGRAAALSRRRTVWLPVQPA